MLRGLFIFVALAVAAPLGAAAGDRAILVEIFKAERIMLLRGDDGRVLQKYTIALGGNPIGHKQKEGDERTPEGRYVIDWRNRDSAFHRSLHISYPNDDDKARAAAAGADPGGMIMIHGIRNWIGWFGAVHRMFDWTNGCIAVSNREIDEIWSLVQDGTTVVIKP